ncbi:hypothetical protein BD289DRAFT_23921 [Coniella lustricola]|uniref:Uncharacterized protein n=1 Tax=Coniella lustricola TaxID=2025994 RepID=A0A2T3A3D9_9PEZI|nr:hypothetical protein BD289DRAFT_23921 [Coniella lustricola]
MRRRRNTQTKTQAEACSLARERAWKGEGKKGKRQVGCPMSLVAGLVSMLSSCALPPGQPLATVSAWPLLRCCSLLAFVFVCWLFWRCLARSLACVMAEPRSRLYTHSTHCVVSGLTLVGQGALGVGSGPILVSAPESRGRPA